MDTIQKIASLAHAMQYEVGEELQNSPARACSASTPAQVRSHDLPIYRAALPNGQRVALLKTMLTSACERNCLYCCFRLGRDCERTTFKPEEMASAFMRMHQAGAVQGLFLSSGVSGGGVLTQDRLIASAEVLRFKLGFRGYLHLKIMPGAGAAQIQRAMQLADRVSINLEAPTVQALARLAPQKTLIGELLQPLRQVEEIRRTQPAEYGWNGRWPSSATQFVVGGAGENDLDLLQISESLHNHLHLARVYFSAFKPVTGTPLENLPPENPWRKHRLYQAAFLLRDYAFSCEDLVFNPDGNLPLTTDPKLAWAQSNLAGAPIEINRASLTELLHVPGIGPRAARAILAARSKHRLRSLEDLHALGIHTPRLLPFVLLDGRFPARQLSLW